MKASDVSKAEPTTVHCAPLSIKLEELHKRVDFEEIPLSIRLKRVEHRRSHRAQTPLSIKLERNYFSDKLKPLDSLASIQDKQTLNKNSSNEESTGSRDIEEIPLSIRLEHQRSRRANTPFSIQLERYSFSDKLKLLDSSTLTSVQDKQTLNKNSSNVESSGSSTLCVQLKHLNSTLFSQKYIEMTPNKQPKVYEASTPQAHIQFSQELKKVLNERNVLTSKTRKHVFDALDEIKTKGEDENRRYKREKALLEIVNSEIKYVHQLEIIINFFLKPTQEKKLLRHDDFQKIFGNILPIYNINKELLEELEQSTDNVAKAFWRFAPFFKVYSVYACEFKNVLKILQSARALTPQFAKLVENQESRPEVQSKLSALLITPIQRVPRYKLLLSQLLELTKPDEEDYNSLIECLDRIEEAAEHINKIVDDQENMQRLLELQRFLKSGEPNIVKPGRTLIKEGVLIKMATKNTPKEKLYTVLMNDIILFGKMKRDDLRVNSLKCISIFPLGKCKVLEILDKGCMRIVCQDEELILYQEQLSETKIWIEKIRACIENHISDRKTLRKDSSSRRPVKRKDLHEYHEVGISPGRPLKKRKVETENVDLASKDTKIRGRGPITRTTVDFTNTNVSTTTCDNLTSRWESLDMQPAESGSRRASVPETSKELFVFGRPHPNDTGFKFSRFLGGVGSSIKKVFGFGK